MADDPSGVRDERLSVTAEVERLEGPFRTGLLGSVTVPDTVKRAVRLLEPRGAAGLDVVLRDRDGERDDRVGVTLRGASVAGWEGVPLAAEDVRGRVDYAADALTCRDVALRVLGAPVRIAEGRLEGLSGAAPRATLDVAARGLPLDRRLRAALGVLADDAAGVWDELDPEPDLRGDVHASVRPPGGAGPPLELRFDALSGGLRVLGLRIVLDEGEARFDGGSVAGSAAGRLGEGDFRAGAFHLDTRSGDARVDLDARSLEFARDLVPLVTEETAASVTSTLRPTLLHVVGARLAWDAAARRLTASGTASLRPAERDVHADDGGHAVEGTVAFDGLTVDLPVGGGVRAQGAVRISETALAVGVDVEDLEGRATVVYDSGEEAGLYATVDEASARLAGFPLEALSFRLHAAGERLRVDDVTAQVHGGRLAGRFQRGGERLAYRGAFTVESLDLALAGGDPGAERAGHVDLDVRFRNPSGEPEIGRASCRERV